MARMTPAQPEQKLVVFKLDSEYYALAIDVVREIVVPEKLSRLPQMPYFMEGICNLRGQVVPVMSLRKRFGMISLEPEESSRMIVVEIEGSKVGCLVDDVVGVETVRSDDIQQPPIVLSDSGSVVLGVVQIDGRLVAVLEPTRIVDRQGLGDLPAVG